MWQTSDVFLGWLWRASWQGSILIVLVLTAQWLLRDRLTPRWRHALWLLVVARLAVPWSIQSPFSLFNWVGVHEPATRAACDAANTSSESAAAGLPTGAPTAVIESAEASSGHWRVQPSWRTRIVWAWLAGALALPACLLGANWRLGRRVRQRRPITDGKVLGLLEDCKQEMGVRTPLTLVETPEVSSPALFGFIRPRLLLPTGLTGAFSRAELRHVFLHELAHLKRADVPLNWLATAPLILHWFNPLVWFALNRMRVDGELASDALALRHTADAENRSYGQTIIKLVEHFSRPAVTTGLVGILENNNQMKRRITMIAKFKKAKDWPVLAGTVFAGLALLGLTDAQSGEGQAGEGGKEVAEAPPQIVATWPQMGATEVDPAITEISVTFDRDMAGGFSWTGGGPDFPAAQEGQKPQWHDRRTCVLPVKLEAGRFYRVGINSKSYQNFRSAKGAPALPAAIFFTTRGASEELKTKVMKPQIVHVYPPHGATDADPNLTQITVTFNVPMGEGFSWTGGGPNYPTVPEGKKAYWTADHKTCVLPVELKPGWEYKIGLNSAWHNNFQSAAGVPLDPAVYTFKTKE